jgi:hypothetical protein
MAMSIKTQLRIAAGLPALFGLLVAAALWFSWQEVDQTRARAQQAESMVSALSELNALTQEYLLFGGHRVTDQLVRQQAVLVGLLTAAGPVAPASAADFQSLRKGQADLDRLLALLLGGPPSAAIKSRGPCWSRCRICASGPDGWRSGKTRR